MSRNWTEEELAAYQQRRAHILRQRDQALQQLDVNQTLLTTPAAPARKRKNKRPEEELQKDIVAHWRPLLRPDVRLLAVNGELPGGVEQKRRAARRKAMGYTRGMPDLMAIGPGYLLWLEVKAKSYPTDEQKDFAAWAKSCGHWWEVVRSVEAAGAVLRRWGMLV